LINISKANLLLPAKVCSTTFNRYYVWEKEVPTYSGTEYKTNTDRTKPYCGKTSLGSGPIIFPSQPYWTRQDQYVRLYDLPALYGTKGKCEW